MSIQIVGQSYQVVIKGDGITTEFSFDFNQFVQADASVANKNPSGIFAFDGTPSPSSATCQGTVVTFNYSSAPAANGHVDVQFTFPAS